MEPPRPSLSQMSLFSTLSFGSPANLQQRLLGFMRPDGGSTQQVQQELQRKCRRLNVEGTTSARGRVSPQETVLHLISFSLQWSFFFFK